MKNIPGLSMKPAAINLKRVYEPSTDEDGLRILVERLWPVLRGGALSPSFGADLVITNADKAGLSGPRAGIMAALGVVAVTEMESSLPLQSLVGKIS